MISGAVERSAMLAELVEVLPDDEDRLAAVALEQRVDDVELAGCGGATRKRSSRLGDGVAIALAVGRA